MKTFTVYSKENCSWCEKVKNLLTLYNLPFKVFMLDVDYTKELIMGMGVKTVPQIFYDGERIGGYTDLLEYFEKHGIIGPQ